MSSASPAEVEKALRRELRRSLTSWARFVLASNGQAPAEHHLAIMAALQRVSAGETKRLMLLLPPGSAKSSFASLLFPAWWFAQHPTSAVIAACHTSALAARFGRGVRDLIDEHSARLNVHVRRDARAAGRFLTTQGGEYLATGVNGAITGHRADLAVIDDPVRSFADAGSLLARERLWNWFRSELMTRLKPNGRIVLAMTRWHSDDLAGRLIEQGDWQVLRLPALAEDGDLLGRAAGDALWPEWEDRAALLAKQTVVGERVFAAMFQQAPLRDAGKVFDPRLLRLVDTVPDGDAVRGWDLAATAGNARNPDWTAGVRLLRDAAGGLFVDDVRRLRANAAEVADTLLAVARQDGEQVPIGLPRDPGQAGHAQILLLTRMLAGYRVIATPEKDSKEVRALSIAGQVAAGNVALRRAAWNAAFIDELALFPDGQKDDQVDALSRAFAMLTRTVTPARFMSLPFSGR